jgi:transcriptional antiterminator RfaH
MTKHWYVVRTKPNSDNLAASAMEHEGFEMYFPRVDVPTEEGQSKRVPLFPGYIFIRCDILGHSLPVVSRFPGVLGWVRFDGKVPHLADEVIKQLQDRVADFYTTGGLWKTFKAGQVVEVSHGKFEGLATVLVEPSSPQARVRVLLDFMGGRVAATVPWSSLSQKLDTPEGSPLHRRRTRGRGRWIRGFGPREPARA